MTQPTAADIERAWDDPKLANVLFARALAKEPEDRHATCAAFRAALTRASSGRAATGGVLLDPRANEPLAALPPPEGECLPEHSKVFYSGCQKNVPIAERFFATTLMPPSFFSEH